MAKNPNLNRVIGTNIKRIRTALGWNQADLCRLAKITYGCLYQIENYNHVPTLAVLLKICKALRIPITDLIETDYKAIKKDYLLDVEFDAFHALSKEDKKLLKKILMRLSQEKTD